MFCPSKIILAEHAFSTFTMKNLFFHIKSQASPLCAAIVLFFMLLNVSGVADTVVRQDGTIVTGTITQRNQAGVTIDIGVTEFFVPSSDIKSVSYSGQQYTLDDAEDALASGEYLKALRIIVDIATRDTTVSSQAEDLFRKAYLAAHNALTSALGKEEHERVAREAEEMLTLLRTFSQFSGFPEIERFVKETGDINARTCLALAKNSLRAYKYTAAEEYLLKAKATVDAASEQSSEILYYLAVTYQGMKEPYKTQQVLAELETAPDADKYELPLLPIRNWVNEAMRAPAPPISVTPTRPPLRTPIRTPIRRAPGRSTPTPAPTPELQPPSSSAPWYEKIWYKVRTTGIYKSAKANYDALAPGEKIFLLLLIPLFIIAWWVIPYQIVKMLSNRDSILASRYRISVKNAGLIMFIIFLFHGLFTKIFKGGFD